MINWNSALVLMDCELQNCGDSLKHLILLEVQFERNIAVELNKMIIIS